jgi:hypothetical protein
MERYIAIDNVCAWPNLTVLPDGTLAVAIYNQPIHGQWHGDVEVWVSADDGRLWERRGVAAIGEPPDNRMDVAAGCAANGDLIVIASGTSPAVEPGTFDPDFEFHSRDCLAPRVCRSADGGRTWERADTVPVPGETDCWCVPFGDIVEGPDGLVSSVYSGSADESRNTAWMLRSDDDGRTWGDGTIIAADDFNETAILHLGAGRWLAACRTHQDAHMQLFASEDDGRSWQDRAPLSLPAQCPSHLTRLADGRLLFTFAMRNLGLRAVAVRFSDDEGVSWSAPRVLLSYEGATDGGYPASSQREDGTIVTVFYANRVPDHQRYHMGVVRWRPAGD